MTEEKEGHRERLRRKFLDHGLEKFTDEEIVELLLSFGTPRRDCKQMARQAMRRFKALRNLFEADTKELMEIPGIGPNNAFGVKFIHQITRKFLRERILHGDYLSSSGEVLEYLDHSMRSLGHETFRVIYLSASHEILNEEVIAAGTATEVPVTPRQIVEGAVKNGATGIVLAHNHPGGNFAPSEEDRALTRDTALLSAMMGLHLLEHLIISPAGDFSFAGEGLIADYEKDFRKKYGKLLG